MPTYLYKCTECDHRFEHAQGFHDDPLEICPDCGGVVRRVIGNVGVAFKGSGSIARTRGPRAAPRPRRVPRRARRSPTRPEAGEGSGQGIVGRVAVEGIGPRRPRRDRAGSGSPSDSPKK